MKKMEESKSCQETTTQGPFSPISLMTRGLTGTAKLGGKATAISVLAAKKTSEAVTSFSSKTLELLSSGVCNPCKKLLTPITDLLSSETTAANIRRFRKEIPKLKKECEQLSKELGGMLASRAVTGTSSPDEEMRIDECLHEIRTREDQIKEFTEKIAAAEKSAKIPVYEKCRKKKPAVVPPQAPCTEGVCSTIAKEVEGEKTSEPEVVVPVVVTAAAQEPVVEVTPVQVEVTPVVVVEIKEDVAPKAEPAAIFELKQTEPKPPQPVLEVPQQPVTPTITSPKIEPLLKRELVATQDLIQSPKILDVEAIEEVTPKRVAYPEPRASAEERQPVKRVVPPVPEPVAATAEIEKPTSSAPIEDTRDKLEEIASRASFTMNSERVVFHNTMRELKSGSPEVRVAAAQKLRSIHNPIVKEVLVYMMDDSSAVVRAHALDALTEEKNEEFLPRFQAATRDADPGVRLSALRAVYGLQGAESVDCLLDALEDVDANVRRRAVTCLGWVGLEEVVPRIIPLLDDRDYSVRIAAIGALENAKSRLAIPHLIDCLGDDEPGVREAAWMCLKKLTKQRISYNPLGSEEARAASKAKWQSWWQNAKKTFSPVS